MMKITVMPKGTLSELLYFLAENERFSSVSDHLGSGVSVTEVRAVLRELAREISAEASSGLTDTDAKKNLHISRKARKTMTYLSAHEEKTLLSAFGLVTK